MVFETEEGMVDFVSGSLGVTFPKLDRSFKPAAELWGMFACALRSTMLLHSSKGSEGGRSIGVKSDGALSRSANKSGSCESESSEYLKADETASTSREMFCWEVGSGRSLTRSWILESISLDIFNGEDDGVDIVVNKGRQDKTFAESKCFSRF